MQIKEELMGKMVHAKDWALGFYHYAEKHNGQFPTNFEQVASFLPGKTKNGPDETTDQFEIVFRGSPASLQNPQDVIIIREKEAWSSGGTSRSGKWSKIYTFADGHSEVHHEPENNFETYEQQHMIPPPAN
jgi:hypothetical protein